MAVVRTFAVMSVKAFVHQNSINAATALLAGLAVWRVGFSPELPAVLAFIFGGVLLAVIEWKWAPLATALAGAVLFANAFFLIWLVGRNFAGVMLIGFGDVRLAALLGLLLGWYGLPYVLYGAIVGNVLAMVVAIITCIHKRKLHMRYSFGPPLIAGALAVVLLHA
jgi:leader peptidase (prepilin peptidase)/N-methyltransferase